MPYPYTARDVGNSQVGDKVVEISLAEKQKIAAQWNVNYEAQAAQQWRDDRETAYGVEMPITAQLEAVMEAELGQPAKMDALKIIYTDIKTRFPKPAP